MSLSTCLIAIDLKKPVNDFPWKKSKEDNSKRTFLITVNKLSASNDVNTHGINKFLKWTSEFNGSSGFFLRKNGPLFVYLKSGGLYV